MKICCPVDELPWKTLSIAAEVAIGCSFLIYRTAEVKHLYDTGRPEVKFLLKYRYYFLISKLPGAESIYSYADR
jgi:hypothetical protein